MNIKSYIYSMRKRIDDKTLLNIKKIIDDEIERRQMAENINNTGVN